MSCELLLPIIKHRDKTLLMSHNRITKRLCYVKNIRKNSCRIRNQLKSRIRIQIHKKNHFESTTLQKWRKKTWRKKLFLLAHWKPLQKREGSGSAIQCTDPRIRIRIKMSRARNIAGFCYSVPILSDIPFRYHNTQLGANCNGTMANWSVAKIIFNTGYHSWISVFLSPCN